MAKPLVAAGIRLLRMMPRGAAGGLISGLNRVRLRRLARREVPVSLIFFATNRCNASCGHCFYWNELSREREELSIAEIGKLVLSLRGLKQVVVTGGEPFLRDDLEEIVSLFHGIGVRSVSIPTNGILTDRIAECVARILRYANLEELKINVSLDGTREVHDALRNVPGCFDRACGTISRLKELHRTRTNLRVAIGCTLSNGNAANLEEFLREADSLRVPMMFALIRGAAANGFGIPPEDRMHFDPRNGDRIEDPRELDRILETLERAGGRLGPGTWNIFQELKLRYSVDILKTRRNPLDCLAGRVDGVVHCNGDVSICELRRPIGNLKDAGMDFRKVWKSEAADRMRESAKRCCCIHGCNLLSNMQYHEPTLRKILLDSGYLP